MISKAITLGKEGKIEFIAKKILDIACEVTLHMQYGEKIILSQFSKENFHPYSYEIEGTFQISITHPEAIIMNHFIAYDSDVMKNGVIHITCDNGSITPITHENLEAFYLENPLRPKIHFTSPRGWINDPNGLCYFQGNYHLFYQYYPHDSVWGNMHWGHAISKDLIHWTHLPITLYPEIEDVYFGQCH